MKLKYIIGLLLLLVFGACSTPLTEEQKMADAVYLKQVKEYTLNVDGSYSYHYYHKLLYNTYQSINRYYGETFVVFNPEFQTLKVSKSITEMADGKVVKSPDNAFNEVLPFAAADAPAYNHLREMVITHVGLERGAVVELEYEIQTKPGFVQFLSDKISLNESSPVKDLEIIVKVPKGTSLNSNLINQTKDLKYTKTTTGDFDVYSWKAKNIVAISHEPLQAEGLADYSILTFSTIDFKAMHDYLKGVLSNTLTPDDASKKLIACEAKGWEKVEKIQKQVAGNINTYGVTPQFTGLRFRSPEEVWKSNGGTEGEKAILLTEMLKLAGFNAQIALAGYAHNLNKEVGCPSALDRVFVKVELDGDTRYLAATDDHSKIPGQRFTVALSDDISSINFEKPIKPEFKSEFKSELSISSEGIINGTAQINLSCYDDSKGLLNGIPSSMFTSNKTSDKKDSLVYAIDFKNVNVVKEDGYLVFNLPNIAQGIASVWIGELPFSRITRIDLPGTYNEDYSFTIKLPKGIKVISPLNETIVENGLGKCLITGTVQDNSYTITRKFSINDASVSADNYNNFRQIITLWSDKNLNKVVFKVE